MAKDSALTLAFSPRKSGATATVRSSDIDERTTVKSDEIWKYIHGERVQMAQTWASFSSEQWGVSSWCEGWTVQMVAGHLLAAAEQTPLNFFKELAQAGFSFNKFALRGANTFAAIGPSELVRRMLIRTTTTNHPPAPVMAMLGEVVVHGEDIRRPLGVIHEVPDAALVAVADSWKNSNLLIGSKRRITGLHLRATDVDWSYGDGPEVVGPMISLVLAMTGRKGAYTDLTGEGLSIIGARP